MLVHPEIDPVALSLGSFTVLGKTIGPVQVHWYGLMYLFAFIAAWLIGRYRASAKHSPVNPQQVEDLVFYGAIGAVLGGRMGYVFFYNFAVWLDDPLLIFRVWQGGMSFHGGLLGVIIAMLFYSHRINRNLIDVSDFMAPLVPLGLGFGRLGNFIGQELWGRASDLPWAMVFPKEGPNAIARHPSQLYQAFLEGVLLFIILFWFSKKPRPRGAICSLFLLVYGCFRLLVEFTRQPDAHIGFDFFGWMTRGQVLSIPMILVGGGLLLWSYNRENLRRAMKITASYRFRSVKK